ncbi:MAG: hypothetical protein R3208_04930 [Ketobacteraceae bacterium]|nr:hypothetical protein [Ketobacteraceae bacterium]
MSGLLVVTSGCAWYQGLDSTYQEREEGFGKRSLSHQDQDVQKFYELQERIELLEHRLEKRESSLNRPLASGTRHPGHRQRESMLTEKADLAIAYIRERTRAAIALIDRLISELDNQAVAAGREAGPSEGGLKQKLAESAPGSMQATVPETASGPETAPVQNADIAGTLERDDTGAVVGSTDTGNRYNFSVVYVYRELAPWFDMWELLEENGVKDKWRGQNEPKQSYFIYVGAYLTQAPAMRRSEQLMNLTGGRPEIRVRDGYQNVAMQ